MDVTSKIPGLPPADLDLSFDEIWDTFDVFAISARGEYWWGQWGLVADGLRMDLEADNLGPLGNGNLQISEGILDTLAAFRFSFDESNLNAPSMRVFAGLRYHYLKQKVSGPLGSKGGSRDWFEPTVGTQLLAPIGEKWLTTARVDFAGLGTSEGSDLTTSVMAGVGYEFAQNWMAKLGYRYYYIDYSDGSGNQEFGLDGNMHGLWLGLAYGM